MQNTGANSNARATLTLTLRISTTDRDLLDKLVEIQQVDLQVDGLKATAVSVVRGLIRREAKAKGLLP